MTDNIVARVAFTKKEYDAVLSALEMANDVVDYGHEFRDTIEAAYAKIMRERKT